MCIGLSLYHPRLYRSGLYWLEFVPLEIISLNAFGIVPADSVQKPAEFKVATWFWDGDSESGPATTSSSTTSASFAAQTAAPTAESQTPALNQSSAGY